MPHNEFLGLEQQKIRKTIVLKTTITIWQISSLFKRINQLSFLAHWLPLRLARKKMKNMLVEDESGKEKLQRTETMVNAKIDDDYEMQKPARAA